MKLYTNPASPFCRKIEVLLQEAGRRDAAEKIAAAGHPTDPGTMPVTVNPIGKIPTLVTDAGQALFDSRVIARFLDAEFGTGLYPEDGLFDVLTLEATGDGICDAAVLMVYEGRTRAKDKYDPKFVESQWAKIARALDHLEASGMDLLNGPLTIGHIAVGCALGYLDFRHGDRNWREGRPELTAWFAEFAERQSMQATRPDA